MKLYKKERKSTYEKSKMEAEKSIYDASTGYGSGAGGNRRESTNRKSELQDISDKWKDLSHKKRLE